MAPKTVKPVEKSVVAYDESWAKKNLNVGMAGVDPADIRPPQILLIQKSSELGDFVAQDGENPKIGQFFHTGKNQTLSEFDCYFVFAAKGKFVNRKKDGNPVQDQYSAIGLYADDLSMFGMKFRSNALYALSPLFTAVVAQKKPMFALRVHVDTKELKGDKGTWHIPVVHVIGPETDGVRLMELEMTARRFDRQVAVAPTEDETVEDPPAPGTEHVSPSDIPF
jgi:hypothetical protein